MLIRIVTPYFVAGLVYKHPKKNICAPILAYMKQWDINKIESFCKQKSWKFEKLEEDKGTT